MSTIGTSIQVTNQDTGLAFSLPYATRVANSPGFSVSEITVTGAEEPVITEYATPQNVMLRLLSGDDVQVGTTSTGPYPFRLSGANDSMVLRLNVEGLRQITSFACVADSGSSLSGDFIDLYDKVGLVRPWFSMPATKASNTLTIASGNAAASQTVTIGATTYTFRSPAVSFVCKTFALIAQGNYFDITFSGSTKRFWYSKDGTPASEPADPGDGLYMVNITSLVTATNVATATELVIEAVYGLTSSSSSDTVTVVYDSDPANIVIANSGSALSSFAQVDFPVNSVLVGSTASISLDNLVAAMNAAAGAGTIYATGTTANASATGVAGAGDTVIAEASTAGTAGNSIAASETMTTGAWTATGGFLTGGTALSTAPGAGGGRLIQVNITKDAPSTAVATALQLALDADSAFSAAVSASTVTVTDLNTGTRTAPSASAATGFSAPTIVHPGAASPIVYLKGAVALGTSQVIVSVAPN